jgi:hypothetical protein
VVLSNTKNNNIHMDRIMPDIITVVAMGAVISRLAHLVRSTSIRRVMELLEIRRRISTQ